ncbi:hypothetical protein [Paraliobacillus sp. JSM ZJ581]|uniref:hypothetical protein n=1 Tax=Paraliobacillus sp. JSM ZJ581 TaxID=3342118 RepID=UPI0035A9883F
MSDYEVKDKGIQSNTEETSAVSAISYEIENALVNDVSVPKVKTQIKNFQNEGNQLVNQAKKSFQNTSDKLDKM